MGDARTRAAGLTGRNLAVYAMLCFIWGSTWTVIKLGIENVPPLRLAGIRMALACLILSLFAFRKSVSRPNRRQTLLIAWSGFLQIGLTYACVFLASQWIESGLVALLFSSFLIWVGLFGHFMLPDEPFTRRTLVAALVGLSGVALIEAPSVARIGAGGARAAVIGGGMVLVSAMASAYTNVLNKRSFAEVSPSVNVWIQTLVGAAALLAASVALERDLPARWTPGAIAALVYMAVLGTAVAFAGLFWLIPRVSVAVVGSIPLTETLLAVALGAVVLHERLSVRILAGGALILAGVALAMNAGRERPSRGSKRKRSI